MQRILVLPFLMIPVYTQTQHLLTFQALLNVAQALDKEPSIIFSIKNVSFPTEYLY